MGLKIKNWIEVQFQSSPKLVGIWTMLRCIFVTNLEIATSIGGELWHGQAQNGVNFDFGVQFDLEGHHHWSKFGDHSLNGWWIIVRTSSWLMDTRTHGHTHIHTHKQATAILEGQNWPRIKISWESCKWNWSSWQQNPRHTKKYGNYV